MRLKSGYEDRKARMEIDFLMDIMFLILVVFVYAVFSMSGTAVSRWTCRQRTVPCSRAKLVITLSPTIRWR